MPQLRSVAEFGCGRKPFGLLSRAAKAEKAGKLRAFVGVDIDAVEAERTARRLGIKMPGNVLFIKGDAVEQIKKFAPESKDVIFASNLFTRNYADYAVSEGVMGALNRAIVSFLVEAKRALTPKGRIVLVHSKKDAFIFELHGREVGLKTRVVELSDLQAQRSLAPYTRKVSSPEKRVRRRNYVYGPKSDINPGDLRPVAVIFRK